MALLLRLSLPFRQNIMWVIGSNPLLALQKYQVSSQRLIVQGRGIGGYSLGAHWWISPIERTVNDTIWVTSRHNRGEILFFPWLLEGLIQIGS